MIKWCCTNILLKCWVLVLNYKCQYKHVSLLFYGCICDFLEFHTTSHPEGYLYSYAHVCICCASSLLAMHAGIVRMLSSFHGILQYEF